MNDTIPTSDLERFKQQVNNPNIGFDNVTSKKRERPRKVKKHLVLSFLSDYTGCGHIRNILPSTYLNALHGKSGNMQIITTPIMITDPDVLQRTRSIFFQRTMGPLSVATVKHYKELQKKFQFKMVYDIDDFIWDGDNDGEEIPKYNFGKTNITQEVQDSAIANMKLMDTVCVSTEFLGDYIASKGVDKDKIRVVHNTLPSFLWGNDMRVNITKKIEKPTVLWSASPTHWHNGIRLKGDMENAWYDWVIKNVKAGRINYVQMGGCPWFFEEIKNDIRVIDWVNSLHYPKMIKSIGADIGIAPLVPNYFNYSKSSIKYQEYCASGIVGIGTTFTNGKPSPYDIAQTQVRDDITVDEIDDLVFNVLSDPDTYNDIVHKQYQQVIKNDWITESSGYVNLMTDIL